MLTDAREITAAPGALTIHLDGNHRQARLATVGQLDVGQTAARQQMRIIEHVFGFADRCERQTGGLELRDEFGPCQGGHEAPGQGMKAQETVNSRQPRISSSAMLSEAAQRMSRLGVADLAVLENRRIIGRITERDLAQAIAAGLPPTTTPVKCALRTGAAEEECVEDVEKAATATNQDP